MRFFTSKVVAVPNGSDQVVAAETWTVRWESRYGTGFYGESKPEVEVFFTEEDANTFCAALRDAFRLIRHTHHTQVSVAKNP